MTTQRRIEKLEQQFPSVDEEIHQLLAELRRLGMNEEEINAKIDEFANEHLGKVTEAT